MIPLIESKELAFYLTSYADIDEIIKIENENENRQYVYSWNKERHQQCIDSDEELHISIKSKINERLIGYLLLNDVNSSDNSIEFRRIALAEKVKGYGHKSIQLVKELCFNKLKCHRLWLDLFQDNERAYHLYLSEGFVQEGILRECKYSNGKYRSMIIMSMLEDEYFKK